MSQGGCGESALDVPKIRGDIGINDDGPYADLVVSGLPPEGELRRFSCLDVEDAE